MIPLIQKETVETHHWVSDRDILDIVAVAESTPGPISINTATFVGYRVAGFWGALCATLGTVLPSFVVILILSTFLAQFKALRYVEYAFVGIRSGVLVLILNAVVKLWKQCGKCILAYILALASFALVAFWNASVILILLCAAGAGIAYQLARCKQNGADGGRGQ